MNKTTTLGAIQVLRNAVGVGVSFPGKSVTKVYSSTLLALRGGGWGSNSLEKTRYVTLEWPLGISDITFIFRLNS